MMIVRVEDVQDDHTTTNMCLLNVGTCKLNCCQIFSPKFGYLRQTKFCPRADTITKVGSLFYQILNKPLQNWLFLILPNLVTLITFYLTIMQLGVPPQLSGFVCAYHPAAPGLSPKHTIYTFSIYKVQIVYLSFELECERNKNKQKEAGIGLF